MANREAPEQREVKYAKGELPETYQPARWVGTLPVDVQGRLGLVLSIGLGEKLRLSFDLANARHVVETLSEMLAGHERRRSCSGMSGEVTEQAATRNPSDQLLYSLAFHSEGGATLSVYEDGNTASVELSEPMLEQLLEQLRSRSR
jgi:hypothetical protein